MQITTIFLKLDQSTRHAAPNVLNPSFETGNLSLDKKLELIYAFLHFMDYRYPTEEMYKHLKILNSDFFRQKLETELERRFERENSTGFENFEDFKNSLPKSNAS